MNNSQGIARDKLKYIAYSFKKEEADSKYEAEPVILESNKTFMTTCKWEGTSSAQRIASIGDWQRYLSSGSLLLFYGNPGFLNVLTPRLLLDMNEIVKTKAVVIIDKLNAKKSIIDKFSSLEPDGEKTPLHDSLLHSATMLSVLGISSISATQWTVET